MVTINSNSNNSGDPEPFDDAFGAVACSFILLMFALSQIVFPSWEMLAYASSLYISLSYGTLTVAHESSSFLTASSRVYAKLALATSFSTIYGTFVSMDFFTKLTLASPGPEAYRITSDTHARSAVFAIVIIGYFIMLLSNICLGLSLLDAGTGNLPYHDNSKLLPKLLKLLPKLLIGIALVGATCFAALLIYFVYEANKDASDGAGLLVLKLWAVFYAPIMLLIARYSHLCGSELFVFGLRSRRTW